MMSIDESTEQHETVVEQHDAVVERVLPLSLRMGVDVNDMMRG